MSAPTPPSGGGIPGPGYYPDPSIPGYVRYWNGAAWVPGTSRPAPEGDEELPAPPPGSGATAVPAAPQPPVSQETGPVFLDEDAGGGPAEGRPGGAEDVKDAAEAGAGEEPEDAARAWRSVDVTERARGRVSWGASDAPALAVPAELAGGGGRAEPRDAAEEAEEPGEGVAEKADEPPSRPGTPSRPESPARSETPQPYVPTQPATPVGRDPRTGGPAWGEQVQQLAGSTTPPPATVPDAPPTPAPQPPAPPRTQPSQSQPPTPQPQPSVSQPPTPQPQPSMALPPTPTAPDGPSTPPAARPQIPERRQPPQLPQGGQPTGAPEAVVPWRPPVSDPFLQAVSSTAPPAGLGRRLLARLVDALLVAVVVVPAAVPLATRSAEHIDEKIDAAEKSGRTVTVWLIDGTTGPYLALILCLFLLLGLLVEAVPMAKWGRTVGKRLLGLQVRDIESQAPPSVGFAIRRWLTYAVLALIPVVGWAGVLWCVFDAPWRQCWHDKAARTYVSGG